MVGNISQDQDQIPTPFFTIRQVQKISLSASGNSLRFQCLLQYVAYHCQKPY